jgi:hypothetical protein
MLSGLLGLTILVMTLFPETALGQSLHRYLVEIPLQIADRIERKHVLLVLIMLCSFQTFAMLPTAELAMAYAVDLSLYADAVVATSLAAFSGRLKGALAALKNYAGSSLSTILRISPRARRSRRKGLALKKPSNDDDPAWCTAAQAA